MGSSRTEDCRWRDLCQTWWCVAHWKGYFQALGAEVVLHRLPQHHSFPSPTFTSHLPPLTSLSFLLWLTAMGTTTSVKRRRTFAWPPWHPGPPTAGCWHPSAQCWLRRRGERPARHHERLRLCSGSYTPDTGEAHRLLPAADCKGPARCHWGDNPGTGREFIEMVGHLKTFLSGSETWLCQHETPGQRENTQHHVKEGIPP